jgi:hypothetical protein
MAWARAKRWKRKIVSSKCMRTALRPVVQQAEAEGHASRGVSSSGRASSIARASRTAVRVLVVCAVPRRHGRRVGGGRQQSPLAEATGQGDRVGEEIGGRAVLLTDCSSIACW